MTAPPRVAVVIPAFNAERYLQEAMRSALAQTVAEIEVVVVDDGSTDGTLSVARSVADPRVRVLTGPNRGRAVARNIGVAAVAARVPYLAFLDADDVWEPTKLVEQLAYLDAHPAALAVGCYMRYISSSGRWMGTTGQEVSASDLRLIARAELAPFPVSSCLVVRRAAFNQVGGFDPVLREAEDLDFLAHVAQRGSVGTVPRVLGSYRIHPGSAMAQRRFQVNGFARFIRARIAARTAGRDLTREQFTASHPTSWRARRRDYVELWYRSAALWYGERRPLRAVTYGLLAVAVAPYYTARRAYLQRGRSRGEAF